MCCKCCSGAASNWWLRSPFTSYGNNFWNVNTSGSSNNNNANNAYGVAPGSSQGRRSNPMRVRPDLAGEKERITFRKVNIDSDVFRRTLLAWHPL